MLAWLQATMQHEAGRVWEHGKSARIEQGHGRHDADGQIAMLQSGVSEASVHDVDALPP